MGQTLERMKEGYSKIRNEALAHAFAYMNLIEHWGSGIPRIIDKVKAAGLREPEFIGGEVDLRINIYRGQVETNNATNNDNGVRNGVENADNIKYVKQYLFLRVYLANSLYITPYRKARLFSAFSLFFCRSSHRSPEMY